MTNDNPESIVQPAEVDLTNERFIAAVEIVDTSFGPEYSKKNPHLVAAVLTALVAASKQ